MTVTRLFVLVLFLLGLSGIPSAQGTPPCPLFDYSVTRSQSQWTVTLYPYGPISLEGVFYSTNQTIDPLKPSIGPWEPLNQHVGRSSTVQDPVTLQDADSSGNITRYDRVEILDETRSMGFVRIGFGKNETYVGGYQGITLDYNYWYICRNAGPTTTQTAITGGLALTAIVAMTTLVVFIWRRKLPGHSNGPT